MGNIICNDLKSRRKVIIESKDNKSDLSENLTESNIQNNIQNDENNIQNNDEKNSQNNDENNIQNNDDKNSQNNDDNNDYESPEILELIINSLINDKKLLLKKLEDNNLNTEQYRDNYNNFNDYGNLKYPEEYKSLYDKLIKEVNELENILKNNNKKNQNKSNLKTQISFNGPEGVYAINVEKETKLGDAFRKTALYKKGSNINKILFLYGGKNVSRNFRKNDTVSSIINNALSTLSIIVKPI
jgi:hypothetical protein